MPCIHQCCSSQACHQLQQFVLHVGSLVCLVYLLLSSMSSSLADGVDVSHHGGAYPLCVQGLRRVL